MCFVVKFYVGRQGTCRSPEDGLVRKVSENSWFQNGLRLKAENCRDVRATYEARGQLPRDSQDASASRMYSP